MITGDRARVRVKPRSLAPLGMTERKRAQRCCAPTRGGRGHALEQADTRGDGRDGRPYKKPAGSRRYEMCRAFGAWGSIPHIARALKEMMPARSRRYEMEREEESAFFCWVNHFRGVIDFLRKADPSLPHPSKPKPGSLRAPVRSG